MPSFKSFLVLILALLSVNVALARSKGSKGSKGSSDGGSCKDHADYSWKGTWEGKEYTYTCAFFTNGTAAKNEKRKSNWCSRQVDGISIKNKCKKSCGVCSSKPMKDVASPKQLKKDVKNPSKKKKGKGGNHPNDDCRDDKGYSWTGEWKGTTYTYTCAFFTNGTAAKNEQRKSNWCSRKVDGISIMKKCKKSCDICSTGPGPVYGTETTE
mmetsp:Transcript_612/g.798  ORF Transcript_612/g.798 Transcript_612/m.798 type:complete len:211 (-) Transcript_612:153-785(-)|eukprot:CAMPEP_0203673996 /NCGR_PEP_ID=MMETSP0090-20130426/14596_1 /ASSEMBLY_ACC=CAM_ASM_001088 /TAXON_ID=426623 /ORGANISM="Chaetoceros affinis, Strain CCMP159" /LENGTH=210 /DNA_ID=CAMNT_0050539765 /DNA_START=53 /DNA_END=685 /DNA_ORIENTATION=+